MFGDTYFSLRFFLFFSFLFVTFLSRCFICLFQGWLWNLRVRSKCIKKLTSIGMSNLKVVCWTNTYQLLLCSCLAWRQIALCESLLNLHFQRVPIHNCHLLLTSLAQITCTFCPSLSGDELMIVKRLRFKYCPRFQMILTTLFSMIDFQF